MAPLVRPFNDSLSAADIISLEYCDLSRVEKEKEWGSSGFKSGNSVAKLNALKGEGRYSGHSKW
jgi:hypothetical protein